MDHQPIFNVNFFCGNLLQVFESDSKTCNNVAGILLVALKIGSCNILLPTAAATKLRKNLSRVKPTVNQTLQCHQSTSDHFLDRNEIIKTFGYKNER